MKEFLKDLFILEKSFPFILIKYDAHFGMDLFINNRNKYNHWYHTKFSQWHIPRYMTDLSFNEFLNNFIYSLIFFEIY